MVGFTAVSNIHLPLRRAGSDLVDCIVSNGCLAAVLRVSVRRLFTHALSTPVTHSRILQPGLAVYHLGRHCFLFLQEVMK